MKQAEELLVNLEATLKSLRRLKGKQIFSASVKIQLRELATQYFSNLRPQIPSSSFDLGHLDTIFGEVHRTSHMSASVQKCIELLKSSKKALIQVDGETLAHAARAPSRPQRASADTLIVSSLNEICPSASLAYQQALADLEQTDRMSWRGPATDLREAMRETLDVLAPDDQVAAAPNFKLEKDARGPTMKQKVRFLLKSRGVTSGAMATPENAVSGVEEIVGGLTRSVYTRSSVSTHTATDRNEVGRVHAWVRIVMCELLELPH